MLKYWVWFTGLRGLSNQSRLALLRRFGSPEDVFYADPEEILLTEGMTREQAVLLENKDVSAADRVLADCQRLGIRLMTINDGDYPSRLKNIYDPPCLLYVKGNLPVLDEEVAVTVVGTRDCTPYGIACAEKLGYGLTMGGAIVATGLAKGIDAAATRGALRAGGCTIGVVGNGLDIKYPSESRYLYDDVASVGVLISEYPPGTEPAKQHFPARNRILSGLSLATVVAEAPARSGALITAELAMDQGRDVFAVPGPIDAPNSAGCNRLIQDGAALITQAWDILSLYESRFAGKLRCAAASEPVETIKIEPRPGEETPRPVAPLLDLSRNEMELTDDQIALLRMLSEEDPMLPDDLAEQTALPIRRVLSALTVLEIEHLVTQHAGKRYTRAVTLSE